MKVIFVIFKALIILSVNISNAASISTQGSWSTSLQGRDLDGNLSTIEAYYDTNLNITWLADANAGAGSIFDDITNNANNTTTTDGAMTQANAIAWTANLSFYDSVQNITYEDWRLPNTSPVNGTSFNFSGTSYDGSIDNGYNISAPGSAYPNSTASEMAYMFYNTLGNKGYCAVSSSLTSCQTPQAGWGLTNSGPFSNLNDLYWSGEAIFYFGYGVQHSSSGFAAMYAWAVHDGDIGVATQSVVPVPPAIWLFGSGLVGLFSLVKRKAK